MTVRTYWAWDTATLRLLVGVLGVEAPTGEERGGSISCRHAHSLLGAVMTNAPMTNQLTICN